MSHRERDIVPCRGADERIGYCNCGCPLLGCRSCWRGSPSTSWDRCVRTEPRPEGGTLPWTWTWSTVSPSVLLSICSRSHFKHKYLFTTCMVCRWLCLCERCVFVQTPVPGMVWGGCRLDVEFSCPRCNVCSGIKNIFTKVYLFVPLFFKWCGHTHRDTHKHTHREKQQQ